MNGLKALETIGAVEKVSLFTLIHLAKDNGIRLFFIKVEGKDLAKVSRPAILHTKNGFVVAQDGVPLPIADYTGYALASGVMGTVMPHSIARQLI